MEAMTAPGAKRRLRMVADLVWFATASVAAGLLAAIAAAAVVMLLAQPAYALTVREIDYVCPIDGEPFSQRTAASGTSFGRMLDLKPFGPTAAPWTLPVCPTSGFVMYRAKFGAEEIALARTYVDTPEYQALRRTETTYYLAAKLQAQLREPEAAIAYTLLQATWQAQDRAQYERYAREALDAHLRLLQSPTRDEKRWPTYELVSGELERRLGLFDEAKARFERLKTMDAFASGTLPDIVELQLKLVAEKDTRPHQVPRRDRPPAKRVAL